MKWIIRHCQSHRGAQSTLREPPWGILTLLCRWTHGSERHRWCNCVITCLKLGTNHPMVYGGVWRRMAAYGGVSWCMVVYGGVWWCMAVYGGVWRCMVMYGGVWRCMAVYGGVWWRMAVDGMIGGRRRGKLEESGVTSKYQMQPESWRGTGSTAENLVSRDQILRRKRGKRNMKYSFFLFSWPPAGRATLSGWSILFYVLKPYVLA